MKVGRITATLTVLVLTSGHALTTAGFRYNRSPSVPTGWYWINYSNKTPVVGDYVAFCLPASPIQHEAVRRGYLGKGPCPGNASALLKTAVAGPGDAIEMRDTGVLVNGRRLPNSATVMPGIPRSIETGVRVLDPDQYFFMSEKDPRGFDGRYFGPCPEASIMGVAHLILRSSPLTH